VPPKRSDLRRQTLEFAQEKALFTHSGSIIPLLGSLICSVEVLGMLEIIAAAVEVDWGTREVAVEADWVASVLSCAREVDVASDMKPLATAIWTAFKTLSSPQLEVLSTSSSNGCWRKAAVDRSSRFDSSTEGPVGSFGIAASGGIVADGVRFADDGVVSRSVSTGVAV
jgi:hypothetical protein